MVAAAAHDVDEWRSGLERALDQWEERLVLRVMDAAHRHADALGSDFARESAWTAFDEEEAPRIARRSLDDFLSEQQGVLRGWEDKLAPVRRGYARPVRPVPDQRGGERRRTGRYLRRERPHGHLLVQSDAHMRRLAVFLAGAGGGAVLAGSLINLMAWGGAALVVLTHPLVLPGAALVGMAAYALHAVGNASRRKAAFLERKRKKIEQWAAEARRLLDEELRAAGEELTASYKAAVARGFVPALEILVGEAVPRAPVSQGHGPYP